jgi:hypothetical protein
VILRIMLDAQPDTQWVAILLGPAIPHQQKAEPGAQATQTTETTQTT